jgi:hypothetical protein
VRPFASVVQPILGILGHYAWHSYRLFPCFVGLEGLQDPARVVVLEMAFWLPRPTALRDILPLHMIPTVPPDEHDVVNTFDGVSRPRAERIPSKLFGAVRAWIRPDWFPPIPSVLSTP